MTTTLNTVRYPLSISVTCPSNVEVGDPVRISDHLTVAKITSAGHRDIIGNVIQHEDNATECVVSTKFNKRTTRTANAEMGFGPFVWGTLNKPVAWTPPYLATVTGDNSGPFAITATTATPAVGSETETFSFYAAAGGSTTTAEGPFTFETGVSDAVKIAIGSGASQDFTLSGSAQTAAQVAAQFSAGTGFTATAAGNTVVFQATTATDTLEIEAVANDAYTVLGLTAAVYPIVAQSNQVKVAVGSGDDQTFTLTGVDQTAAEVAAQFSAATGFTVTAEDGGIVLTADDAEDDLVVKTVTGDCYTELGLVTGTFASVPGADSISITVGSGDPTVLQLTPGAARTAAQIAAEINAGISEVTATLSGQKLVITCDILNTDFTIDSTTNDCYTALGFAESTIEATAESHDSASIGGVVIGEPPVASVTGTVAGPFTIANNDSDALKIKIGGNSSETFDLTAGTDISAATIVAEINDSAVNFVASSDYWGYITFTALEPWDNIVIEAIANDAYGILGFSTGTTTASKLVETLEY